MHIFSIMENVWKRSKNSKTEDCSHRTFRYSRKFIFIIQNTWKTMIKLHVLDFSRLIFRTHYMFNRQKHTMFKKFTLKNDTMDKIVPLYVIFI